MSTLGVFQPDLLPPLVVFGLVLGSAYALAASGLVVIFRGTGVFNLAQGAVAMCGAYFFADVVDGGMSIELGVVLSALVCGVIGVLVEVLLMRPLARAGTGTQVVATLGVFLTLQAVVILFYGLTPRSAPTLAPFGTIELFGEFNISYSQLTVLVLALVLFATLYLAYQRTRIGLQMQAVAQSRENAALQGINVNAVAMLSWVVGCICAGIAGIMLAPMLILDTIGLPLIVIESFAAALIGGLVSFPMTLVGALALGLAQSTSTAFTQTPGTKQVIAYVLIVLALLLRKNPLHEAVEV